MKVSGVCGAANLYRQSAMSFNLYFQALLSAALSQAEGVTAQQVLHQSVSLVCVCVCSGVRRAVGEGGGAKGRTSNLKVKSTGSEVTVWQVCKCAPHLSHAPFWPFQI